jgi:hypothetical protein
MMELSQRVGRTPHFSDADNWNEIQAAIESKATAPTDSL